MSSNKKRIFKIFCIIALVYIVFAIVVLTLFHHISTNPIDIAAITYLRSNADVEKNYGNIIHIGRNLLHKTERSEIAVKAPYTIETEDRLVTVYVTLMNDDKDFEAVSYEVIEVRENAN